MIKNIPIICNYYVTGSLKKSKWWLTDPHTFFSDFKKKASRGCSLIITVPCFLFLHFLHLQTFFRDTKTTQHDCKKNYFTRTKFFEPFFFHLMCLHTLPLSQVHKKQSFYHHFLEIQSRTYMQTQWNVYITHAT